LTVVDDVIRQRIEAKEAVVRELIAGRVTLPEATARFMALNQSHPEYLRMIRENYPGSSDEEKTARNVIDYSLGRTDDRGERDRLGRRLNAELRTLVNGQTPAAH
jgi:hypothetical protein